ncbi:hypothetical protein [Sphingobacterium griseoflavum]|uniref:hypothetical protein n=1 Tax=Sphingobacterium griseoflavum TaxID=1474952 RepID=UPI00167848A2|nr:hypothetical protein [Sphingobacterium griseoflavum]
MMKKLLLHILLVIGLVGLVSASALQYTHHQDHHDCAAATDKHGPDAEHCSLCWFVSHQVLGEIHLASLLPEAESSLVIPAEKARLLVRVLDQVHLLISNKDPPVTL